MPHPTAIFAAGKESFDSLEAARAALTGGGFTLGPLERDRPSGFVFGPAVVSTWSSLAIADLRALHGQLWTTREGATTVMLHQDAPTEAVIGFQHVLACADAQRPVMPMGEIAGQAALIAIPLMLLLGGALAVMP